jgi:E3 ubiquitin-protein ligase UBR1
MIAQIRTGLWVRNGLAIRGQLLHYRDYMLRELCYDQDLFIIQSSFILSDPNTILVTILRRFQLLDWFSGDTSHASYEGAQLYTMVEEFLYVLITSLSEYANARKLSVDEIVKREAIHALALGPCSYTDLCKRVAERIIDEASFDRALGEISTFRAPEGTSDVGIFELKDEMFDHVNPFFFHFTRNRREEVEGILKARLTRKTGIANPVIVPKRMGITEGPFVALAATFSSTAFLKILVFGIYNAMPGIRQTTHSSDAVLDQILHLISLALVEQPASFSPLAARVTFPNAHNQTLLQLLCTLETMDTMKNTGNKLQWCLDVFIQYVPAEVAAVRRVQPPDIESVNGKSVEAKKRAAKARQAAIMKKFAAQQESFLLNIEDEVMSEDEEPGSSIGDPTNSLGSCIVCQEALDSSRAFGALGLVQPSRFRREMPAHITRHVAEVVTVPKSLDDTIPLPTPPSNILSSDSFHAFPANGTAFGLHSSFCGHLMHMDCFTVYSFSIEQRHLQQTQRNHAENIDRDEFICPLCKSLGNVILPVRDDLTFNQSLTNPPAKLSLTDWIRGVGIELLKAPQDRQLDQRLDVDGSGEFSFWTAEDADYPSGPPRDDTRRMVQTLKTAVQSVSEQSRHLHGRPEPSMGSRGAGLYLPKHLVAYTISCMEISQRGIARSGHTLADGISDSSMHLIRASLTSLRTLAGMQFPDRADGGRTAIRQAVMKRMMPQWTRDLLRLPLFDRDPLTLLVEVCAVAPDILPYATPLMYYACLARTCLGLIRLLSDLPSISELPYPIPDEEHNDLFGDIRIFVHSLTRHSPVVERITSQILRSSSGRFEKLVYSFTLPFLRCAAILTRAVTACPLPEPTRTAYNSSEYARLLDVLGIPPVPGLPQMEGLQTVLAGWSETYAEVHSNTLFDYSIKLEVPSVYRLAQLPYALDNLFMDTNTLRCQRCKTIPVDAAICMFCGTICCYQMHCCVDDRQRGEGECNSHTRE